jgi:hypothetical protein
MQGIEGLDTQVEACLVDVVVYIESNSEETEMVSYHQTSFTYIEAPVEPFVSLLIYIDLSPVKLTPLIVESKTLPDVVESLMSILNLKSDPEDCNVTLTNFHPSKLYITICN